MYNIYYNKTKSLEHLEHEGQLNEGHHKSLNQIIE